MSGGIKLLGSAGRGSSLGLSRQSIILLLLCAVALAGCGPSGPQPQAGYNKPLVSAPLPNANTGPTMSEAGPAPPAFDRYGNANFDANGTYIGGHGIGTQVDNPDQTTFGIPKSSMPDISSMHCTGSSISNAGSMNCTN
jgi:hypothetical protein